VIDKMKTKIILFLNVFLAPILSAVFFHDPRTLTLDFSFYIDKGWIDLISVMLYFSIPINAIYCFIMAFKKKEKLKVAITYGLVGIFTSLSGIVCFVYKKCYNNKK